MSPLHTAVWCALLYGTLHYLAFAHREFYSQYVAGHEAGDAGALEYACAAILAAGALLTLTLAVRTSDALLRVWCTLFGLGLVFLLGEELNWGQLVFDWETTGWFARYNDEGETNFHNATSWLDQKPRTLLNIAIVAAGIVHPVLVRFRGTGLFGKFTRLAPSMASLPAACFVVLAGLPKSLGLDDRFSDALPLGYRVSEVEELFVYVFFLAYALSLVGREGGPATELK